MGQPKALAIAVKNKRATKRLMALAHRLRVMSEERPAYAMREVIGEAR